MKQLLSNVCVVAIMALLPCVITSCSKEADVEPDDPIDEPIVEPIPEEDWIIGQWYHRYKDGDNYVILTYNADGTGNYYTREDGKVKENDMFTYTYEQKPEHMAKITREYGNGSKERDYIKFIHANAYLKGNDGFEFENPSADIRIQRDHPQFANVISAPIVGRWKYERGSRYIILTYRADGTGHYFEYNGVKVEDDDEFAYTYESTGENTAKIVRYYISFGSEQDDIKFYGDKAFIDGGASFYKID